MNNMQSTLYILKNKIVFRTNFLSILALLLFSNFITFEFKSCSLVYAAGGKGNVMDSKQFTLLSSDFKAGQTIPKRHTADGSDLSPELSWTAAPSGTKSFALICEDPDAPAGTWIHWLIYDIPASKTSLPQGIPPEARLKDQSKQGINSFRHVGYGGPSPPPGSAHRYFFKLYALNDIFGDESSMTSYKFKDFIQKHKIAEAEIMGTYGR